jgi:hypothetical protein
VSLTGKAALGKLDAACAKAGLVILADRAETVPKGCTVLDARLLQATGPLAVWTGTEGLRIARTRTATRLWSPPSRQMELPSLAGRQGLSALATSQ